MSKLSMVAALLAVALLWALPARAAGAYDIGLGAGYALPVGDMTKGAALADQAAGAVPIQVDAVYRYTHRVRFGVTGSYGPVPPGTTTAGLHAANQWRMTVGALGEYHWAPFAGQDPWVSLSVYWTQLDQQITREDLGKFVKTQTVSQSPLSAEVRGGYQFSLMPDLYVGPYVSAAIESYTSYTASSSTSGSSATTAATTSADVPSDQQTWHAWFGFGITGRYGF
ncbi:MAG: autotransporter domain-containing protein [Deltaproteobacteria bacterium]|nr:autotransporter domain-containing protein [Deltaproteobacteria bacterium]